jgi:hypothetical protein
MGLSRSFLKNTKDDEVNDDNFPDKTICLGWKPNQATAARILRPNSLEEVLFQGKSCDYSFICVPPRVCGSEGIKFDFSGGLEVLKEWQGSLVASSDRTLSDSRDWSNRILFEMSIRDPNLTNLLDYAAHLTVFAVLIDSDWTVEEIVVMGAEFKKYPFQVYLKCPFDDWRRWRDLCSACEAEDLFSVVPEMSTLSSSFHMMDIWRVEPGFKSLIIDEGVFVSNAHGYPVLPRCIQDVLSLLKEGHPIILETGEDGMKDYSCYMRWLLSKARGDLDPNEFTRGFENVLQTPLQPLRDHLPSETYEVFEMDPVKYRLYGEAVVAALGDLKRDNAGEIIRVGVFGAGRGPLVEIVLEASERIGVSVEVLAVEKSPNACLTLLDRFRTHPPVQILFSDMRHPSTPLPPPLHLIISELLGSFADNELAPECLKAVERADLLMKPGGVMIPREYRSFVEPCYAPGLRRQAERCGGFDCGYVVHVTEAFRPFSAPLPLFHFSHPSTSNSLDCDPKSLPFCEPRNEKLQAVPIDGLIGYFDCILYGNVRMSTVPCTASKGMLSWFPIYFPLSSLHWHQFNSSKDNDACEDNACNDSACEDNASKDNPNIKHSCKDNTTTSIDNSHSCTHNYEINSSKPFIVNFARKSDPERRIVWYEWGIGENLQNQSGVSYNIQY